MDSPRCGFAFHGGGRWGPDQHGRLIVGALLAFPVAAAVLLIISETVLRSLDGR
ncbi:hypothetical protein ACWEO2_27770 [Nocardia sp. NPDC004278]